MPQSWRFPCHDDGFPRNSCQTSAPDTAQQSRCDAYYRGCVRGSEVIVNNVGGGLSGAGAPLVHARGLRKNYGEFTAVDGVDFDVLPGQAFGFLGPNGAGKSSTMRMIQCVSPPSAGELSVLHMDPVKDGPRIRARLGVVPQEDTLDTELSVRDNLLIYARYFDISR